jgi:Leucine-rich repeat (LRR) protein
MKISRTDKGRTGKRIVPAMIAVTIAVMVFAAMPAADSNDDDSYDATLGTFGTYNPSDIMFINNLIDSHGLSWTKIDDVEIDDFLMIETWPNVWWSGIPTDMNRRIIGLDVSMAGMTGVLNLDGLTTLEYLKCGHNSELVGLNISKCVMLKELYCDYSGITSLNLTGLTALETLACSDNELTVLDLSGQTELRHLDVRNNRLDSLTVFHMLYLERLHCENNSIVSLNASGLASLTMLDCYNNELTELNISDCTGLKYLDCQKNNITVLNVTDMPLEKLYCAYNNLSDQSKVIGFTGWDDTYYIFNPQKLTFTHSTAYNIPASTIGLAIININVSGGASGGDIPYRFSATGLPEGITIADAGIISGIPATAYAAGTATITVTDINEKTKSITISYGAISPVLVFDNNSEYNIPASTVGTAIANINLSGAVSGGTAPYAFTAAGLPAGLTMSSAGIISGTPTAARAAGTATITVTDDAGEARSITISFGAVSAAAAPTVTGVDKDPDTDEGLLSGTVIILGVAAAAISAIAVAAYVLVIRPKP